MRGARPIPDKTSYNFIKKNVNGKSIYENNLVKDFCNSYSNWIQSSKLNNLQNLNKFKHFCVKRVVAVSEEAPEDIQKQVKTFQDNIQKVIEQYMQNAIKSDRITINNQLEKAGFKEAADLIRKL